MNTTTCNCSDGWYDDRSWNEYECGCDSDSDDDS